METKSLILAYQILIEDLLTLIEYIDPQDSNRGCFSHRTFELLLRSCTELENLWKSKLIDHKHPIRQGQHWNIVDYAKLESEYAHDLSTYEVAFVHWKGQNGPDYFTPYADWTTPIQGQPRLVWYDAYNQVKHAREANFAAASLQNVIMAIGALHITLHSFFSNEIFFPQPIPSILRQTGIEKAFLHFDIRKAP